MIWMVVIAGCTREPITTRVVAEKNASELHMASLVSSDRWVCFVSYKEALQAEIGKPYACRWEK